MFEIFEQIVKTNQIRFNFYE